MKFHFWQTSVFVFFHLFLYFLIISKYLNGKMTQNRINQFSKCGKKMEPSRLVAFVVNLFNLLNLGTQHTILKDGKYREKYFFEINNYEIIVPERINREGLVVSYPSPQNKWIYNQNKNIIFYKLPLKGNPIILQLKPNNKFIRSTESANRSQNYKCNRDMKIIQHPENCTCHYTGKVRNENNSKVAVSICNGLGLAGYFYTKGDTYFIEPLNNYYKSSPELHIIYKQQLNRRQKRGINNSKTSNILSSHPLYIETLIVIDESLINYFQEFDSESYILTLFNIASNLLLDVSLQQLIILSVVRIIKLEKEEKELNLQMVKDPVKIFKNFQEWQYYVNPGDDSHPNHHDIAVLLTRIDCFDDTSCGLIGITELGTICDSEKSAILTVESGLRTGFYLAHQIAHLLGVEHDTLENDCFEADNASFFTIMHPNVAMNADRWSECSKEYVQSFLESNLGKCLKDKPFEHNFNGQDLLPGAMFDVDFQCKTLISKTARRCDIDSTCDSLNCYVPGLGCIRTEVPLAEGTSCGENLWCFRGKCLMVGQRPGTVDGNWGSWSDWSDCSRTCGSGVSFSIRQCNKPVPSHGGKYCVGPMRRYRICATEPCPIGTSFRDLQCKEFNDWIYPEDGKKHIWKEYYYRHSENPCKLFCINEKQDIVALKPRVIDGTECHRGSRDICKGGKCQSVPCNLEMESKAVEDACGVCHGDGSTCEFSQGIQFFEKIEKTWTKLINIPIGTKNIIVEELAPTSAKIIVRDKESKEVYVRGDTLGMFQVPGSQAWLGMFKNRQEILKIPDPVTKPLSIWIDRSENVTVRWSVALPVSQQKKPEFTWDFLTWGPCSVQCGKGVQVSHPSCIEQKSGLVEEAYCADFEKPSSKVRSCEVLTCKPRWMVSDWKECKSNNSTERKRKRKVNCVKSFGEMGESIVADSECGIPKPHEQEPCKYDKKFNENFLNNKSQKSVSETDSKGLFKRNIFQDSHENNRMKEERNEILFHNLKSSESNLKNEVVNSEPTTQHKFKKIRKGELIIDRKNVENEEIEIVIETNENGQIIKIDPDLINIPKNSSSLTLRGKKIYELLKKLREKD